MPATTARVLTYRVMAQVLSCKILSSARWDASTLYYDSSGGDEGELFPLQHPELSGIDPSDIWILTRDAKPHSWLWEGRVWTEGGDRIDLHGAYRSGKSVEELAVLAIARARREQ